MLSTPAIKYRDEVHYAAIRKTVAMKDIPTELPPLISQILQWVSEHNLDQAGPVFFRYRSMDSSHVMVVDVGVPLSRAIKDDNHILGDIFPAGKYLTAIHTGPYDELRFSHASMEKFVKSNGIKEALATSSDGSLVGARAEFYITDPAEIEDPRQWVTEISFLIEE